MNKQQYREKLALLLAEDDRYPMAAYHFVADAVSYTVKKQESVVESAKNAHISGRELLEGIKEYALGQFGPLALDVLHDWHIQQTEDFGQIVFNMVRHNLLGASEHDSMVDFTGGYDFRHAFLRPFAAEPPVAGAKRVQIA